MLTPWTIVATLIVASGAVSAGLSCGESGLVTGGCGVRNDGTSITVGGERTTPGRPEAPAPRPRHDGPRSEESNTGTGSPRVRTILDVSRCVNGRLDYFGCVRTVEIDPEEETEEENGAAVPAVTISDLAQFAPSGSTPLGEPDNVGVAGLPTNFVAGASVQTRSATLFGTPLSVRFTPSTYEFHYGDGSSSTTRVGGQTWSALGQAQFTPTDTSHTYRERGAYQADVDVRYTAEIDLGSGWFPISGELTTQGPAQQIRIFEAQTALVAYTCAQKPDAPGC